MSGTPVISIIVPIYNVEFFLRKCLESICEQTYKDFEVLLVNDGSTDGSLDICNEYVSKDPRFFVHTITNSGQGIARNYGLKKAIGDYVTFIDSDDFLKSDYLSNLIDAVMGSNADLVIGGYQKITNKGEIFYKEEYSSLITNNILNIKMKMLGALPDKEDSIKGTVWNSLYKMSLIEKNNIVFLSEREFFSEDTDFNLKYLDYCSSVQLISTSSYRYRLNLASTSTKYDPNKLNLINKYYLSMRERFSHNDEAVLRLKKIYLANVRRLVLQEKNNIENCNLSSLNLNIKKLLSNDVLNDVVSSYPICKLNGKKFMFFILLCKFKCSFILAFIIKMSIFRNKRYLTGN